jgi:hypothetical protein
MSMPPRLPMCGVARVCPLQRAAVVTVPVRPNESAVCAHRHHANTIDVARKRTQRTSATSLAIAPPRLCPVNNSSTSASADCLVLSIKQLDKAAKTLRHITNGESNGSKQAWPNAHECGVESLHTQDDSNTYDKTIASNVPTLCTRADGNTSASRGDGKKIVDILRATQTRMST